MAEKADEIDTSNLSLAKKIEIYNRFIADKSKSKPTGKSV